MGLVTNYGEGGLQNGRVGKGDMWSSTPTKRGVGKVLAILTGGAQKDLGYFLCSSLKVSPY